VVPTSGSFLYLNSEVGDYVGGGTEQLYTTANSKFTGLLDQGGDYFRGSAIQFGHVQAWYVDIAAPRGHPLAPGSYLGAVGALSGSRPARSPGLEVYGGGGGCNTLTGSFDVDELSFTPSGRVSVFQATFEQHCEGAAPALFGRFRFEYVPPTPGVTLPPGSIVVPTTGSFLYLNSQPGEYVGQGIEQLYTSADTNISGSFLYGSNGYFRGNVIQGDNVHWWYVDVAAPPGEALAVGSYVEAVRAAFRLAGQPGLDVFGDGRGCNAVTGKFDIDALSLAPNGDVAVLQATFEEHCEGGDLALFGRLRYEAPPPLLISVALREEGAVTNKTVVATIGGTVSCSRNAFIDLAGTLTQVQAKGVTVTGPFTARVECNAPKVPWSTEVWGENGSFKAGSAIAAVTAEACEARCQTSSATRSVKLNLGKS
jgi:hypothetical protein